MSKNKTNKIIVIILFVIIVIFCIQAAKAEHEYNEKNKNENEEKIITTTTTAASINTIDYKEKANKYDLLSLNNSKSNTDKIVKSMNKYLKNIDSSTVLKYDSKSVENGRTFYVYKTSRDVTLNIVFNNKKKVFHCISVIGNKSHFYNYTSQLDAEQEYLDVVEAIVVVSGLYNDCYDNIYCRIAMTSTIDRNERVVVDDLLFEYDHITDTFFSIMNED